MPTGQSADDVPARVVDAYDQMMRQVIGPALRQLGFTGTLREFRYGSRSQSGVVAWQKDGREVRRQVLSFTANVNYWCGEDRIGSLMPVPAPDTWWQITGGQCYEPVAASVITAVRRYALPAIQAGLEDPGRHDADMRYTRASGPGGPDGGGAATTSWFVRPAGTAHDEAFGWLASADPSERLAAAEIASSEAPGDPRTPAALVDRLSQDPNPMVRKLIASRMLPLLTSHPEVISALQAAAAGDTHTGAGQIARHFRLGRSSSAAAPAIRPATRPSRRPHGPVTRVPLTADPADVLRSYMSAARTESARALAAKAAVLIVPSDRAGKIIWPNRR